MAGIESEDYYRQESISVKILNTLLQEMFKHDSHRGGLFAYFSIIHFQSPAV